MNNGSVSPPTPSPPKGSGVISVNGSAARRAAPGDILIIATFAAYNELELVKYAPELIYVDSQNRVTVAATGSGPGRRLEPDC